MTTTTSCATISLQDSSQFQTVYSSYIFKLFRKVHFVEIKGQGREEGLGVDGDGPNI